MSIIVRLEESAIDTLLTITHSWDSKATIPNQLLSALHQRHPSARFHLSCMQLDPESLSSSQLHGLRISIPCSDDVGLSVAAPFKQMMQLLRPESSIRALSIDVHQDQRLRRLAVQEVQDIFPAYTRVALNGFVMTRSHAPRDDSASVVESDRVQLPILPSDQLPPLEELTIFARMYDLSQEHCESLRQCMDWTKLKRLRLSPSNPIHFFQAFTGHLPLLEDLDFTYRFLEDKKPWDGSDPPLTPLQVMECKSFVTSLPMLTRLVIRCDTIDLAHSFWNAVALEHGRRLRHLTIRSRFEELDAPFQRHHLADYFACFQQLTTLEMTFRPSDGPGSCPRRCKHVLVR